MRNWVTVTGEHPRRGQDAGDEVVHGSSWPVVFVASPSSHSACLRKRRTLQLLPHRVDVADRLASAQHGPLPVVDSAGAYLGTATVRSVTDALADGGHDRVLVGSVVGWLTHRRVLAAMRQ